jgi:FKBP-type peptidyl-prolyl cis-trans isomerase (trigger factor)
MSENEKDRQPTAAESGADAGGQQPAAEPAKVEAGYTPVEQQATKQKSKTGLYVAAVVIVVVTLLIVLFMLEKEGRSSTGLFDSYLAGQENGAAGQDDSTVVAVVNGEDITGADLNTSIQQFNQAAVAQGADTSSPEVAADIRSQALDVLVNTALLRQAAREQGIEASSDAVDERLVTIQADIGGEEALLARISELGLTYEELEADIAEEVIIQTLLDGLFVEAEIAVTEEEIQSVYDAAGGTEAGLPPLEEVRDQVVAQVRSSKEQEIIDAYLSTLEGDAEVVIN